MQNRIRNKQIVIRMSEEEYQKIKKKVNQSELTQQEYLIRACNNKKIIVIDGIRELTVELKRIGNNLNQIARACNEGRTNCKSELSQIERGLADVWQLLRQLVRNRA